ncbi:MULTISPECIES: amidohydrolase [Cupriavidus]
MTTTVFAARKILTMNPAQPEATHVAVRDGRILAVGNAADAQAWGPCTPDDRFAGKVLMPGLVEGHSHAMEGGLWQFPYVGFYPRRGPDGTLWQGLTGFDAVTARLAAAAQAMAAQGLAEDVPLLAWGFDPIFFGEARMSVRHLDRVSATRPIVIMHASMHLMNVNSATLARAGIDRDTDIEGIARFADGEPTGELQEFAAMFPVTRLIGNLFRRVGMSETGLRMFGQVAVQAGVTTATDLVNDLSDESVSSMARVCAQDDFPLRMVPAFRPPDAMRGDEGPARLRAAMRSNHERLHAGLVKLVVDGSIQGFTARLRWPGYFNGAPNGIWVLSPAAVHEAVETFHAAGFQLHIHTNGDEATEVALDAVEQALARHPRADHRHTLQHCQMADEAQFARMARLGMCVNLFANHLYYWGDAHLALTMGPDRARRMDACATAQRLGVPFAIHSDAPITPLAPLFTAWCAVNRTTAGGVVLGASERITVPQALSAITLGAAFTLRLDHEIGSIAVRKRADFCVLEDDPLAVAPAALKDIGVWGTVVGGRPFEAPRQ